MTCVFVAAKMEETVKKTREVAVAFLRAIHGVESQDFDGEVYIIFISLFLFLTLIVIGGMSTDHDFIRG